MNAPFRPALRYMGSKWKLAPRIVPLLPPHRAYSEPFGGGAAVLLRKPRSYAEIYNDLDDEVVGMFRVLRDPTAAAELLRRLALTPFARTEFLASYEDAVDDPIERARRLVVRSFMGHGSTSVALRRTTGFRSGIHSRRNTTAAADWARLPPALSAIVDRLQGVAIENRPALDLMARDDAGDTLLYVDPPYVHETRSQKRQGGSLEHAYKHEMTDQQHVELLDWLCACKSMVVLSGYAHPIYDERLQAWRRVEMSTHADGGQPRTEVLWINPAAVAAAGGLFAQSKPS